MASINVAFDSEEEAQQVIEQLSQANLGEVRARILSSTEVLSYEKTQNTSPTITPNLGTVEIRPTETPQIPDQQQAHTSEPVSADVPQNETVQGVQVVIEFEDQYEQAVRAILARG